ncbi:MAG: 3'-5' exonuclease, partial [Eubacteriales bacterium]|nr:3'-5' exonuclease [Eubacteriales bacterium]
IYEHWITKDIIAYLRAADGNMSRANMLRIINKPVRYITRAFLSEPVNFDELSASYRADKEILGQIDRLQFDLNMIKKMTTFAAVNYIRKAAGYDGYIEEFAVKHHIKPEALIRVADEVTSQVKAYDSQSEWINYIEKNAKELNELEKKQGKSSEDYGVQLRSIHSSKGLEFRAVFILDFNEGMIPYKRAVLDEEVEEERRLLYVAMTRAREYLYILYTRERYNKKMTASRFLREINRQSCKIHSIERES